MGKNEKFSLKKKKVIKKNQMHIITTEICNSKNKTLLVALNSGMEMEEDRLVNWRTDK